MSLYKSAYDYFCSTNLNNLLVGFGFVIFTCAKLLNIFMHIYVYMKCFNTLHNEI